MTYSQYDTDFASKSHSFVDWFKQQGTTISPKIELADLRFRNAGRGVLATDDIGEDEDLFSIPRSSILTVETSSLPPELRENDDPWLSLIVAMVYECRQGSQSKWRPYLDVLPEHFDTLMFWSTAELDGLEGSAVVDKIGKDTADEAFQTNVLPKLKKHAETFRLSGTSDEELLSLCHRMGSTIMAYAFDLEKPGGAPSKSEEDGWEEDDEETVILPKGMVPFADMLNADADRNNAKLYYEEDKVVMKTIKPVRKGEELLNDYGSLPNADVLRRYGYVSSNYDKYDVVELSLDVISWAAQERHHVKSDDWQAKINYLEELGALEDGYDISRASDEDGQFSDELCILLNMIVMPRAELDALMRKDKLPKPELSKAAETLLWDSLVRRRAAYRPDTIYEADVRSEKLALEHSGATDFVKCRRRDMAQHVVLGERKILQEAACAVAEMSGDDLLKSRVENFETEAFGMNYSKHPHNTKKRKR